MWLLLVVVLSLFSFASSNFANIKKQQRQLTEESDLSHPCVRECIAGVNKVCYYSMVVDWYSSMSVQCGDCPFNLTHCDNPGCIVGGGIVRPVISANRRTPGPSIMVCENDTVIVDVTNAMEREMLTVHWHGIHQVGTPYMDGAPFVTQCPIMPSNSFRYHFTASPHGTHMWHGHVGYHDSSGLFGAFVVRRPEPDYVKTLYDYDLPEHTFTVWHWYNQSESSVLPPILDTYGKVNGYGLLINGHASFGTFPSKTNSSETISTPKAKFFIDQGKRYRFRVLGNGAIYCPVQMSIDKHTFTVISSETDALQPVEVDSLVIGAGERFDLVVQGNQSQGCYWMRFRGLGDCDQTKTSTHGEAILCYTGDDYEPTEPLGYELARRSGKILNPVEVTSGEDYSKNELVLFSALAGLEPDSYSYNSTPDVTLYVELTTDLYSEADAPGPWHLLNKVYFEFPAISLLTQRDQLDTVDFCEENPSAEHCIGSFCGCTYTKKLPLDALVEIVFMDFTTIHQQDHPMHMHGYKYYVVAMGTFGPNDTLESMKSANEKNLIQKTLHQAPSKDTVNVPNYGYAIVRFRATNPGFWLLHCHVTNHLAMGMAMLLQVGEPSQMGDIPANSPTCGNTLYDPAASLKASAASSCTTSLALFVTLTAALVFSSLSL